MAMAMEETRTSARAPSSPSDVPRPPISVSDSARRDETPERRTSWSARLTATPTHHTIPSVAATQPDARGDAPSLVALESLAAASPSTNATSTPAVPPADDAPSRRLADVSAKFSQFYSDLESEKARRSEAELGRRNQLFEQVQRIELDVEAEARRRRESERLLREKIAADMAQSEARVESKLREVSSELARSVDLLRVTVSELREGLREERKQRREDVERLAEHVVERVEECQSGIDDERVARLEREALTLKRVGEDVLRISEKVDDERAARETCVAAVRNDLDALRSRETAEADAFQTMVLSDLAAIKTALNEEKRERVGEDEASSERSTRTRESRRRA